MKHIASYITTLSFIRSYRFNGARAYTQSMSGNWKLSQLQIWITSGNFEIFTWYHSGF